MAEEDVEGTVFICIWPQCDGLSSEGFGNFHFAPLEMKPAALVDFADELAWGILNGRQRSRHAARTGPVALCWRLHGNALVGPLVVIDGAPAVKLGLRLVQVAKDASAEDFGLQAAVKALVLAVALRVPWRNMRKANAQANKPYAKLRQRALRCATPGRAIVGLNTPRQAVALKTLLQPLLRCLPPLVGTSLQNQVVARMVIHNRQWVTAPGKRRKVALKVYLPELVGRLVLEALPRLCGLASRRARACSHYPKRPSFDAFSAIHRCSSVEYRQIFALLAPCLAKNSFKTWAFWLV